MKNRYFLNKSTGIYFYEEDPQEIEKAFMPKNCVELSEKEYAVGSTISGMIQKFGEDSQIDVAIEEMSELIKELIKYKRSKIHFRERQAASRDHVVEEIGDVMFMIEYLKSIFDISDKDIQEIVLEKAKRTRERYLDGKE